MTDTPPTSKPRRWRWLGVTAFVGIAAVWWWRESEAVARREAFVEAARREFVTMKTWRTGSDSALLRATGLWRLFCKDHYLFTIATEAQADAILRVPLPPLENVEVAASATLPPQSIERLSRRFPEVKIVR